MIFLIYCLSIIFRTLSIESIQWKSDKTSWTVHSVIRTSSEPWITNAVQTKFFHYKTHFGIIIKQDTTFQLEVESSSTIESLYFYCLTDSRNGTYIMENLSETVNFNKTLKTNFDCVPMISVSHNVPAVIKIEATDWIELPIFDSKNITYAKSNEETEFYNSVQIYGFVENYYTQMLLSIKDINDLKLSGHSLYQGLQNQIDLVEYYDYLTDPSYSINYPNVYSIERSSLFIRSERCSVDCPNVSEETSFNLHFISVIGNIETFLRPTKGSSWVLLQKFAQYYNKQENTEGFGETLDLWIDILATLYHQKYKNNNLVQSDFPYKLDAVPNYEESKFFEDWTHEEKLSLFVSLFGYDGTDTPLKEFRIRYLPLNQSGDHFTGIIPTILEMFLDIYINLLPFLSKVINFKQYTIPLLSPDLELRLLCGQPLMPAVDFGVKPLELQVKSKKRDLREISPLMLITKLTLKYFEVIFNFESPVNLTNSCLYLNNKCKIIIKLPLKLKLISKVYSVYIVKQIDGNLYFSEIMYHTIIKDMPITVNVKKINENGIGLPMLYYFFDAHNSDNLFLQIFINYKDMTIRLKQLTEPLLHESELYFSITLKRNGTIVFEHKFPRLTITEELPKVNNFQIGDIINIYHAEPTQLKLSFSQFNKTKNNTFILTNVGLRNVAGETEFKITLYDAKKISEFLKKFSIHSSCNKYYEILSLYYKNSLSSKNLIKSFEAVIEDLIGHVSKASINLFLQLKFKFLNYFLLSALILMVSFLVV